MLCAVNAYAQKKDSCQAGVYITERDFISHNLSHKINTGTEGYKFEFPMPADLNLSVKITTPDTVITFKKGTIYGYYTCGKDFRYYPGGDLLAQQDFYRIDEAGHLIIYKSVFVSGDEYFYSRNLTAPIHRLRLKKLEEDFKDQPGFIAAVQDLNNKDIHGDLAKRDENGNFLINKIYEKTVK